MHPLTLINIIEINAINSYINRSLGVQPLLSESINAVLKALHNVLQVGHRRIA